MTADHLRTHQDRKGDEGVMQLNDVPRDDEFHFKSVPRSCVPSGAPSWPVVRRLRSRRVRGLASGEGERRGGGGTRGARSKERARG